MIWKSTIREIRNTFGRFFAILAIIALGVGFFSGLKVTKQAMVETTGQYFEEQDFYDYRLLSTLGFTSEDVDYIATEYGIARLKGRTLQHRAEDLIHIAHPDFRPELIEEYERRFKCTYQE